jgi:hypothetical protein
LEELVGSSTNLFGSLNVKKMKSEKMRGGEENFIVTILCGHTFHWECLKNYNDTICPLCRYL